MELGDIFLKTKLIALFSQRSFYSLFFSNLSSLILPIDSRQEVAGCDSIFRKEWQEANTNSYLIKTASYFAVVYFRSSYLDAELCEIRNILRSFLKNRKKIMPIKTEN